MKAWYPNVLAIEGNTSAHVELAPLAKRAKRRR